MIRIESRGTVRVVMLDRPEKRNALTVDMLRQLDEAMQMAAESRAVVLLGAGMVFCAGFDLLERVPGDDLAALREQLCGLGRVVARMRGGGVPVVIGVQGAAVAGGCALLGGGDIVVAERCAKLGYPVLRLGVSPAVTTPYLSGAVGDGACRAMVMDPALIGVERAMTIGLVHEVVDSLERVHDRAIEIGEALAKKPGGAVGQTRRWLGVLDERANGDWPKRAMEASLAGLDDETVRRLCKQVWKR